MVTSHLIFTGSGVYSPRICPRAILWQRREDALMGVYVPSVENAKRFADVTVVSNGQVIEQVIQEGVG